MAKVTISRLFEISKFLKTKSGQELEGALSYLSELAEVTLRILRNGITFSDNIDCEPKTISLQNQTVTTVFPSKNKTILGIVPLRVQDQTYYVLDRFGWFLNTKGEPQIYASFLDSAGSAPASTRTVNLTVVIHFG